MALAMLKAEEAPRLFPVSPAGYRVHALHSGERFWPQTNCYADLWIEIIHQLGSQPEAAFGFTMGQDFEGDQFTFFKPPLEDLYALYGLKAGELALYDDLITHIEVQIARKRMVLVELDSFYLPDTRGVSYRETHGKTTVGINRLDRAAREVDYFHNEGFFHAAGEDFDGLFGLLPELQRPDRLFPYAEMVRLPERAPDDKMLRSTAAQVLARHFVQMPQGNPVTEYVRVAGGQAQGLMAREDGLFHLYAFNTLRQLGANFELLASHLAWLGGFETATAPALAIAEGAKVAQFQLARAMRAKDPARFVGALEPLPAQHDALRAALRAQLS